MSQFLKFDFNFDNLDIIGAIKTKSAAFVAFCFRHRKTQDPCSMLTIDAVKSQVPKIYDLAVNNGCDVIECMFSVVVKTLNTDYMLFLYNHPKNTNMKKAISDSYINELFNVFYPLPIVGSDIYDWIKETFESK
jgi:hypothetical protein